MRVNIGLFQFSDMIMGSGSGEIRNLGVIGEFFRILAKKLTNVVAGHPRFHLWRLCVLRYNSGEGQRPFWIPGNQFGY